MVFFPNFLGSYDGFLRLWKIDPKTKSIQPVQDLKDLSIPYHLHLMENFC